MLSLTSWIFYCVYGLHTVEQAEGLQCNSAVTEMLCFNVKFDKAQ